MSAVRQARAVAVAGVMLAAAVAAGLTPLLTELGGAVRRWQIGFVLAGVAVGALVGLWSRFALPTPPEDGPVPPAVRQRARDFPAQLTLGLFAGSVAGAMGTLSWFAREHGLGAALLPAVVVYVVLLLPLGGIVFALRRTLRPLATAVDDAASVKGRRQSINLRIAVAVQLPVMLCALGITLVEQTSGADYDQAAANYAVERYGRLLGRVLQVMPSERARQGLLARLRPPAGILISPEDGGLDWSLDLYQAPAGRPASVWLPMLALAWLVIVLTYVCGRWLGRQVTADLSAVGAALDGMQDEGGGVAPTLEGAMALREIAELAAALDRALEGFEVRRQSLERAAADRRASERAKARFLGHLSHELKSPLNSILGFSELLVAELDGPITPRQRDQLAAVWRQGESLERFILTLLDLARLEEAERASGMVELQAVGLEALAAAVRAQDRPDPLDARRVTVTTTAERTCLCDVPYTARALRVAAGLLLDVMEAGEVRVVLAPSPMGVAAHLSVAGPEADEAERTRLVAALQADPLSPAIEHGAAPVTLQLLKALAEAQGGRFEIILDGPWPAFRLELPAA